MTHPQSVCPLRNPATVFRKYLLPGILLVALAACTSAPAVPTPMTVAPTQSLTRIPPTSPSTASVDGEEKCPEGDRVCLRWFIGHGTGTDPTQIAVEEEVARDFNASQDRIVVTLKVVAFANPYETFSYDISTGSGPDVVGPMGWTASYYHKDEWLPLDGLIDASGFDTSIFDPALLQSYRTEQGQISLPFAVWPGAMYYVPAMFDATGLAYPPQKYGEKYKLDGRLVDWDWQTITEVARRLTLDDHGRNATQSGFDHSHIVQFGYIPQWQLPLGLATSYAGAAKIYEGKAQGEYKAAFPDGWKEAWQWYYDGMWGAQSFIPSSAQANLAKFGAGNVFNSGNAAMALTQAWYTCCLSDFVKDGHQFQLAVLPMGADGSVHGRVDADSFRIWKGTLHPAEAFQFLAYLLTTGADKLLPIYDAMPAVASKAAAFIDRKKAAYPFVTEASWEVFVQGLHYPDSPSTEQYQPNWLRARDREQAFMDLMNTTPPDKFDFEAEFKKLVEDLNVIYNQ